MDNRLIAVAALAAIVAGCAATGPASDGMAANAYPPGDCKAVVVDSTAQAMRMDRQAGVGGDAMDRVEGALGANRLDGNPPRALRAPPGTGLAYDLNHNC